VSSRRTEYQVTAWTTARGVDTIIGRLPQGGQVRIHQDCWGDPVTCQRTRAGGIYNGSPSIFDWYRGNGRRPDGGELAPAIPRGGPRSGPPARLSPDPRPCGLEDEFGRIAAAHRHAILRFTARSALPPSVTRVFKGGTKDPLVNLLGRIPMDELLGLDDEPAFRSWFVRHLDEVAGVILGLNAPQARPGIHPGYKWGHGTKVLALYIRDVVLFSRYFSDPDVERIQPWLYCPIDGVVMRRLRLLGEPLGVALIREIDTPDVYWDLQDRMGAAAAAVGVPRVWFDDNWGDREL
jgi:hypothetical protein